MRYLFILLLLIVFNISVTGQQINLQQQVLKRDYPQKIKNQNTAAWILTGGGAALIIAGAATHSSKKSYFPNEQVGTGLLIGGGVAAAAGIILFATSPRNKNNSGQIDMALSMQLEKTVIIQNKGIENNYFPVLSFKIMRK